MQLVLIGALISLVLPIPPPAAAQADRSYKILATSKTSTMQKEMQEAERLDSAFWPSWVARQP